MQGMLLTLDHQRGALIIRVDETRHWCTFRIKAGRGLLSFYEVAQWHVVHGEQVCAVVYRSLPPGDYTLEFVHEKLGPPQDVKVTLAPKDTKTADATFKAAGM